MHRDEEEGERGEPGPIVQSDVKNYNLQPPTSSPLWTGGDETKAKVAAAQKQNEAPWLVEQSRVGHRVERNIGKIRHPVRVRIASDVMLHYYDYIPTAQQPQYSESLLQVARARADESKEKSDAAAASLAAVCHIHGRCVSVLRWLCGVGQASDGVADWRWCGCQGTDRLWVQGAGCSPK